MNKTCKKINQRACYNSIWSWSPMPCEKHGPRASVTTKTSAFGLGFCLLSPSGHVFHTAWETMIKSYSTVYAKNHAECRQIVALEPPYNWPSVSAAPWKMLVNESLQSAKNDNMTSLPQRKYMSISYGICCISAISPWSRGSLSKITLFAGFHSVPTGNLDVPSLRALNVKCMAGFKALYYL